MLTTMMSALSQTETKSKEKGGVFEMGQTIPDDVDIEEYLPAFDVYTRRTLEKSSLRKTRRAQYKALWTAMPSADRTAVTGLSRSKPLTEYWQLYQWLYKEKRSNSYTARLQARLGELRCQGIGDIGSFLNKFEELKRLQIEVRTVTIEQRALPPSFIQSEIALVVLANKKAREEADRAREEVDGAREEDRAHEEEDGARKEEKDEESDGDSDEEEADGFEEHRTKPRSPFMLPTARVTYREPKLDKFMDEMSTAEELKEKLPLPLQERVLMVCGASTDYQTIVNFLKELASLKRDDSSRKRRKARTDEANKKHRTYLATPISIQPAPTGQEANQSELQAQLDAMKKQLEELKQERSRGPIRREQQAMSVELSNVGRRRAERLSVEVCRNFKQHGRCRFGQRCRYSHGESTSHHNGNPSRGERDHTQTIKCKDGRERRICWYPQPGKCRRRTCEFAHEKDFADQTRIPHPRRQSLNR
jgi:hypothetical protein